MHPELNKDEHNFNDSDFDSSTGDGMSTSVP